MRSLFMGLALLAAATPAAAQSVKAGIEAWQKGDVKGAVAIWRPLAERGDADAAFNLGQAYRLGNGVPLDLAQAQGWLEAAARKGHVDAQATLGLLLFQNGNRVAGLRWLKGAAKAGEPRALLMVGTALYNGDGVARDPVTAYAYVSRAAAQGLASAKSTLADMDEVMPLEQRQQGVALARKLASGEQAPAAASAPRTKPPAKVAALPRPAPPLAKPAVAPVVAAGGTWRIQLGAFSTRAAAASLYSKLSGRLGGAQAIYVPVGAMTRLQAGPYASKAAASAACSKLSPQPCFVVPAK